jgi:UDP-2-acetamido-2,6-beta-L-arabino-hexul-4-ose reductase
MKKKRVGVTGYTGFIGSHLVDRLKREAQIETVLFDDSLFDQPDKLTALVKSIDCLVHLAGMNRGPEADVYSVNIALAEKLVAGFKASRTKPELIFSSSILSETDTAFGKAKKEACRILAEWGKDAGAKVALLTIPNVFGDRGKPFYNSVVATFCFQLTHGQQPTVIQDREVELIYINDLVEQIFDLIIKPPVKTKTIRIKGTKLIRVAELLKILEHFRESYLIKRVVPGLPEPFLVDLYNVFIAYLDYPELHYEPLTHRDDRGELSELIKLEDNGQIFFSTTKPGVVRGNHYHTRKQEKFCVLKGEVCVRMRRIGTTAVEEFRASGARPAVIDIPIFHTHHLENVGQQDLLMLFWSNELFDPADSDTYPEEVMLNEK